jgi:geranylgeranyl diphosphate synthase, type I
MGTMSSVVGKKIEGVAESAARGMREKVRDQRAFEEFIALVRAQVDARLAGWLGIRVDEARSRGDDVAAVADAVRQLVLRGGKRMRAVLLAAAYEGCRGAGGSEAVVPAGAALELLQAYLLVHDDWMDGDDVRRGGPSVPAMMRARFLDRGATGAHQADAASVLAGDLAAAWALASLLELTLAPPRVAHAVRELARIEEDVVHGQLLDVCASAGDALDVEAGYALKTASYTVRGPVVMGARLAGADDAQVASLVAFAEPLGVAFQLRDDVLGTFGDARATGKPSAGDLREGKRTALVVEAMGDPGARELLSRVLGRPDASEADIAATMDRLRACGACGRVEDRIAALVSQSREALRGAGLTPAGGALLAQAAVALTERDR